MLVAENRFCSRYGLTGTTRAVFLLARLYCHWQGPWGTGERARPSPHLPCRDRLEPSQLNLPDRCLRPGSAWASEEFGGLGVFQNNSPPNKRVQSSISPAVVLTTFSLGIRSRAWTSNITPFRREIPPELHSQLR